jgi:hypothetical protein
MPATDPLPFDWSSLTSDCASILVAYFALFREHDPTTIGSGEIIRWFRQQDRTAPSESLLRTVLTAVGVPRRGEGRPPPRVARPSAPPPFASGSHADPPLPKVATQLVAHLVGHTGVPSCLSGHPAHPVPMRVVPPNRSGDVTATETSIDALGEIRGAPRGRAAVHLTTAQSSGCPTTATQAQTPP